VRERGARHAADAERPLAHALGRRVDVEVEENTTRELAQAHGGEVRGGSGEVPGEVPEEERAVAALEPDLVVVHDHRRTQPGHGRGDGWATGGWGDAGGGARAHSRAVGWP